MTSLSRRERQRRCTSGVDRENHTSGIPRIFFPLVDGVSERGPGAGNGVSGPGVAKTRYASARERMSAARGPITLVVLA